MADTGDNPDRERIEVLEERLAAAQARYERLRRRKSVRIALALSGLLGRRRQPEDHAETPAVTDPRPELETRLAVGPTSGPLVSIVVLTRDGRTHLEALLTALMTTTAYRSFEVVVVDNASSDGTDQMLDRQWGFPMRVITNPTNVSFSRGCNQGVREAQGDLILLLNNDVVPVSAGWLGGLVAALQGDVGAVGAVLAPPSAVGAVQHERIGFRRVDDMPRPFNVGSHHLMDEELDQCRSAPAATAACLLVRREALEAVGGLDERFEYGLEDVDFCLRIGQAGWRTVVTGQARLYHQESTTVSRLEREHWRSTRLANRRVFEDRWSRHLRRAMDREALDPSGYLVPDRRRVIAITVTDNDPQAGWGDWYTAHELGDALEGLGWTVQYAEARDGRWYELTDQVSIVISLIDRYDARRAPADALCIAWVRNWTDRWAERPWLPRYDAVVPSSTISRELLFASGVTPGPVLPLATNPRRFRPGDPDADLRCEVAFTGNYWGVPRPALDHLHPDTDLAIYGRGWGEVDRWRGRWRGHQPYESLPAIYRSARVVIDDTAGPTLPYGAVNARVFDAIASGALVLTDNRAGSEEVFGGQLPTYADGSELRTLLERFLGDEELRKRTVDELRSVVTAHHTYALRAVQLLEAAETSAAAARVAILADGDGGDGSAHRLARLLRQETHSHVRVTSRSEWSTPWARSADLAVHRITRGEPPPTVEGRIDVWWSDLAAPSAEYQLIAGNDVSVQVAHLIEVASRAPTGHFAEAPSASN